ncbi:MAG: hypothetical protein Q7R39_17080 [Dehalococcoidia bacterium]|nr:hypothetical protein [Dehalococcoidia bacterium]
MCNPRTDDDRQLGYCFGCPDSGRRPVILLYRVGDHLFCQPCIEKRVGRKLEPVPVSGYEMRPDGAHWCKWKLVVSKPVKPVAAAAAVGVAAG